MFSISMSVILDQFDQKSYKYWEVAYFTDMHRNDSDTYKKIRKGESFKCYHLFQVQKYSFTFSQ